MEFLKGMRDFVRNPLGIIALFISLIYGIAGILLGSTASSLTELERWPIIIFIVLFPVLVLFTFYKLVTKHHTKLYSPTDFRQDSSFIAIASDKEVEEKYTQEAAELAYGIEEKEYISSTKEKESIKTTQPYNIDELKEIEEKVINKIERESNIKAQRHVKLAGSPGIFDAIFQAKDIYTVVEVVFWKSRSKWSSHWFSNYLNRFLSIQEEIQRHTLMTIVIVHTLDGEELLKLMSNLQKRIEMFPNIKLRFIDEKELDNN